MRNILARLLGRASIERRVNELIIKHLELTEHALSYLIDKVERTPLSKLCEICEDIRLHVKKLEVQGDDIVKEVWFHIMHECALAPSIVPIMAILLGKLDDMLDSVSVFVLELERYANLEPCNEGWTAVQDDIVSALKKCQRASQLLRECIVVQDREVLSELVKQVNDLEHDVDVVKNSAILKLSRIKTLTCQEYICLRNLIQIVDNIADLAQDAANLMLTLGAILLS